MRWCQTLLTTSAPSQKSPGMAAYYAAGEVEDTRLQQVAAGNQQ
jgi:hypothetical protein